MNKYHIKPLSIKIIKEVSSLNVETQVSNLPHILGAYQKFKSRADDEYYINHEGYDDIIMFPFRGIQIELSRNADGTYYVFYGSKNADSLAAGVFNGNKFEVTLFVGKKYKKIDKLMTAIEVTGIYFSNPNVMDKLQINKPDNID